MKKTVLISKVAHIYYVDFLIRVVKVLWDQNNRASAL